MNFSRFGVYVGACRGCGFSLFGKPFVQWYGTLGMPHYPRKHSSSSRQTYSGEDILTSSSLNICRNRYLFEKGPLDLIRLSKAPDARISDPSIENAHIVLASIVCFSDCFLYFKHCCYGMSTLVVRTRMHTHKHKQIGRHT